jgi:rhodanese-related sulfurtransferase
MSSETSSPANGNPPGGGLVLAQAAGILFAAVLLGVAYNRASPLRVSATLPGETVAGLRAVTNAAPAANMRTGSFNETISLSLDLPTSALTVTPPPAPAKPAPSVGAAPSTPALVIPAFKWPQVKALLDAGEIVLLDARLKVNYDLGHIPGAVLLPATSSAEELQAFAAKYPKDTALVTYCGSDTCHMSHQLAELLIKICGFTNVSSLPGGYAEYVTANPPAK